MTSPFFCGIVPYSLVLALVSADYFASAVAILFRGEQIRCFVAGESRTAVGPLMRLSSPYCALSRLCGVTRMWSLRDRYLRFRFAPLVCTPEYRLVRCYWNMISPRSSSKECVLHHWNVFWRNTILVTPYKAVGRSVGEEMRA